jgi:hypothetical protein
MNWHDQVFFIFFWRLKVHSEWSNFHSGTALAFDAQKRDEGPSRWRSEGDGQQTRAVLLALSLYHPPL